MNRFKEVKADLRKIRLHEEEIKNETVKVSRRKLKQIRVYIRR